MTLEHKTLSHLRPPERGATLVEMLVAMAISVLVFGIITTALVQFVLVTHWGNSTLQTSSDIQVTSLWLGRDALEAYSFTPGSGAVYGTLNWEDTSHQYRYSYDAVNSSLVRTHLEDGSPQSTNIVARHIASQSDVVFSLSGKLLTVTITSTSEEETETVTVQFALRVR